MIIDLDKLAESTQQIHGEEVVNVQDVPDVDQRVQCHIDLLAKKSGETFYLHTKLLGTLSARCHKCLRPTNLDIETAFDVVIQRGGAEKAGHGKSVEDDYVYIPIGEQEYCLDQHIYENLVVSIPMRITCSENCKGLCPECGVNLNEETCSCKHDVDPRWKALDALKDKFPKS